ncbi:hypothetical protein J4573_08350 [Actinomadura barringtoniae]|uniref:Uncharacterized protein n=1 Tax=Actinomadura barringtoniae TaxID=1427535 RepID=A0A939T199_9ACTN|nr:hypothetical protein [Actinomadura barringtoniae]MBO2447096.1 hypothetical protein [Actinomadura barringtoniae]
MADDGNVPTDYSDENTEQLARGLSDQAAALSDALSSPLGVTQPTTARAVVGRLIETTRELVRSFDQLNDFLVDELNGRRLSDVHGLDPSATVWTAQGALTDAAAGAEGMIAALGDAHDLIGAVKPVPSASSRGASAVSSRAAAQSPPGEAESDASARRTAGADFPMGVGDALQTDGKGQPEAPASRTGFASRLIRRAP